MNDCPFPLLGGGGGGGEGGRGERNSCISYSSLVICHHLDDRKVFRKDTSHVLLIARKKAI